jgi:hypothetical protein
VTPGRLASTFVRGHNGGIDEDRPQRRWLQFNLGLDEPRFTNRPFLAIGTLVVLALGVFAWFCVGEMLRSWIRVLW